MVQSYKKIMRYMRYVTTFLIEQTDLRIWWQEVAQGGASDIFVSDGNIPNENKHPKRFIIYQEDCINIVITILIGSKYIVTSKFFDTS